MRLLLSVSRRFFATGTLVDHYNVLGVSPKATQLEIKAAYYKLSKIYHPDINQEAEAALKFRAINEAYEVIGNVSLKKLYDKGVLNRPETKRTSHQESSVGNRYTYTAVRPRTPGQKAETVYDFDAWTREHYGKTFEQQFEDRTISKAKNYVHKSENFSSPSFMIFFMLTFLVLFFIQLDMILGKKSYDENIPKKRTD